MDPGKLAVVLLVAIAPCLAQGNWYALRAAPSSGEMSVVAYDSARQRTVMFGGGWTGTRKGTWEWDGSSWLAFDPPASPEFRTYHALAYDPARRRVVLFGGVDRRNVVVPTVYGDTWEWDGVTWSKMSASGPCARYGHALCYDPTLGQVVLFGGYGCVGSLADTWTWNGSTWVQRLPAASPSNRSGHAMSSDAGRQRIVLFGGGPTVSLQGLIPDAQTWEWDGTTWAQAAAGGPPARYAHGMAYDGVRQRTVLFGGYTGGAPNGANDTWEWSGSAWSPRALSITPAARAYPAMVYDSARQRIAVCGGGIGDTWEFDGNAWQIRAQPQQPPSRLRSAMTFDSGRQRTVLFGGQCLLASMLGLVSDTWEFDGANWRAATPAVSPTPRSDHVLCYHAASGRTVLFGGLTKSASTPTDLGDTWEWDGVAWTMKSPAVSPPARSYMASAYDSSRQKVVIFGGLYYNQYNSETWEWDGQNWRGIYAPVRPAGRTEHAMAYDAVRKRVVVFGGLTASGAVNDTWVWDGATWVMATPPAAPSPRNRACMVWDSSRQRIVLLGGNASGTVYTDTWDWDGQTWTQLLPATSPTSCSLHAMAYDSVRQRVVSLCTNGETWLFGNLVPASTMPIGSGCPGSRGIPVLAGGSPYLGNVALTFDLGSVQPGAAAAILLAAGTQSLPIGGGCSLYVAAPWVPLALTASGNGFGSVQLAVPLDLTLRGGVVFSQAVAVDPLGSFLGLCFSGGLRMVVGD